MTDRPMIFSSPMIRALIAGRKTQTRRLLKLSAAANPHGTTIPSYYDRVQVGMFEPDAGEQRIFGAMLSCSGRGSVLAPLPCRVGDRVWVREAWGHDAPTLDDCRRGIESDGMPYGPYYLADANWFDNATIKKRSPIHMPRWASRITLTITDVRVERLQEISAYDLFWEGFEPGKRLECGGMDRDPRDDFCDTWERLNGEGSWDANPVVIARTFTVARSNIDSVPKSETGSWTTPCRLRTDDTPPPLTQ
jgi:hypothetical protein